MANPFGAPALRPTRPEKGSFPLDREGQCQEAAHAFLGCINKHHRSYSPCRQFSKAYLECRMEKNLMQQEDLSKLGFKAGSENAEFDNRRKNAPKLYDREREREGFVAGTGVKSSRQGT